ncbi:hypothetical protein HBH98_172500 [Parastagonospora nodorum]|nr:hypothetical protein HBH53_245200 [Parastagonospora nodorum]KAH3961631.1 hypothetical protein HBH51_180240 [Parastagonospora nodorum]KAH3968493.1 hypothetical protein HBH52_180720 [Parastagonospora nodorum]KAH3991301.1 hypothetical protein HBI10_235430 [Parastagonospora nodorum]KAH4008866.1 hypothetical protein HBI13_227420 [Parastagonospora nodorum]
MFSFTEKTEKALATPSSNEASGRTPCVKCRIRYVEHTDKAKKGKAKDQPYSKCQFCRGVVKKGNFPSHLKISETESLHKVENHTGSNSAPTKMQLAILWQASITPERESVLIHSEEMMKLFSKDIVLHDLPRATPDILWTQLGDRMRDLYSLESLFGGFASLSASYAFGVNTLSPICLLAVALNNAAVADNSPFKFCWMDVPFEGGVATLIMALNAWSTMEKLSWSVSTPSQRIKLCSVWESHIFDTANAVILPYRVIGGATRRADGKVSLPSECKKSLTWIRSVVSKDLEPIGTLIFQDSESFVWPDQCANSTDLLHVLVDYFHNRASQAAWKILRRAALDTLHMIRAPSAKERDACHLLITQKRRKGDGSVDDAK